MQRGWALVKLFIGHGLALISRSVYKQLIVNVDRELIAEILSNLLGRVSYECSHHHDYGQTDHQHHQSPDYLPLLTECFKPRLLQSNLPLPFHRHFVDRRF